MFDILKKKITGFIDKITNKEEKPTSEKTDSQEKPERITPSEVTADKTGEATAETEKNTEVDKTNFEKEKAQPEQKKEQFVNQSDRKVQTKDEGKKVAIITEKPKAKTEVKKEVQKKTVAKHEPVEKQVTKVNVGIISQIKGVITGHVELGKKDLEEMLDTLEIEMLESDVALEVAEEIIKELKQKLSGQKVKTGEVNKFVKDKIFEILTGIVCQKIGFDIIEMAKKNQCDRRVPTANSGVSNPQFVNETPLKIMLIGINGAGKTTTIAKIANMLIKEGFKVAVASADTFRAAAIEQMQVHADKLGIKNIKREYGGDPTAVAYDAVNYSKAHGIDVLLIDTAGRQDTNLNLINELKKMNRVIQPDLRVYVGESISGSSIITQVSEFKKEIGIDGVILTKLDCDAKGGAVLSITKMTDVPIVYICTGQKYEDIEKFDGKKIIEKILN